MILLLNEYKAGKELWLSKIAGVIILLLAEDKNDPIMVSNIGVKG